MPCVIGVAAVRELSLAAVKTTKNKGKFPVSFSLIALLYIDD